MDWLEIKVWLESATGLDRDALHIYCALAIQLFLSLFFRRALGSPWPWIAVLVVASVNEYFDYQGVGDSESSVLYFKAEAYHDMWNTMAAPTILMLIARYWPGWMTGRSRKAEASYAAKPQPKTAV